MTQPLMDRASGAVTPATGRTVGGSGFDAAMVEARRSVRWLAGALAVFVIALLLARLRASLLWLAAAPLLFAAIELFTLRRTLIRLAAARRAEAQVEATRTAAAEAENRAKSRFLAEMSHELRTPLNAVIGFSEVMAQEVLGPHANAAYRDYAQDIHASGQHLLSLADDILDLARIETGHRQVLETAVNLGALAQDCAHMMRLDAAERHITLIVTLNARPRLWADERAVRQMVLNLMANAVKFTPAGGTIELSVDLDAAGAPFCAVEDNGPGLGEAELPLALSPHHRESRRDPASGHGAGLGLAIVRALAQMHEARLDLTERTVGGTRATLSFPVSRRLAEAESAATPPLLAAE